MGKLAGKGMTKVMWSGVEGHGVCKEYMAGLEVSSFYASIIKPARKMLFTFHGPVHRLCSSLSPSPFKSMLLSDFSTYINLPV